MIKPNYKYNIYIIVFTLFIFMVCGCNDIHEKKTSIQKDTISKNANPQEQKDSSEIKIKFDLPEGIITKLPTDEKVIALTFDACETKTPVHFDEGILSFLISNKIPFTVFISGKFAKTNSERLTEISRLDFVGIENHSLNHFQHMEKLSIEQVLQEVTDNEKLIFDITGRKTKLFRFPGGNYNDAEVNAIENLGYRIVHWEIPSGDPDKHVTKERLVKWVLYIAEPGSILIFHINGKGYKTAEALPEIADKLKEQGYKFVKLEDYIK